MITLLTLIAALPYLAGGKMMDSQYEQMPYLKDTFWDDSEAREGLLSEADSGEKAKSYKRARELALGVQLLRTACCEAAAIISGGAQDTCLLMTLPVIMCGYCH